MSVQRTIKHDLLTTWLLILVVGLIVTPNIQAKSMDSTEKLNAYLRAWTDQDMFSGVVLVAQQGEVLLHQAYGQSDRDQAQPNTLDTQFRIGSLTKSFTALLALKLVEQGCFSLDDPLSQYLPDYPRGEDIQIDMLLNHRSGIVDHTTLPDFQTVRREKVCSLQQTIAAFQSLPLEFEPGSKFKYSSSNYILLGTLIETVTHQSFADLLQTQILTPLQMNQTGFLYQESPPQNMACGYRQEQGRVAPAQSRVMQNAHGSGALYSTARDLYTWCRAFAKTAPWDRTVWQKIASSPHREYAYGWAKTRIFDKPVWAHGGDTEGFKSWMMSFTEEDVTVIVLSNFEQCLEDRIAIDLAAIVLGQPYRMPKQAAVSQAILTQYPDYVGVYQVKPNFAFTITHEGKQLFCQATGQGRLELHPENEDTFFIREVEAKIVFKRNRNHTVTGLVLQQSGHEVPVQKQ